jgi:hypothetical protein
MQCGRIHGRAFALFIGSPPQWLIDHRYFASLLALALLNKAAMTGPLPERRAPDWKAETLLFVVSRLALEKYLQFEKLFAGDDRVTIIYDRRSRDRRGTPSSRNPEGRRADRRSRPLIDDRLRRQGWVMVRVDQSQGVPDRDYSRARTHGIEGCG